MFLAQTGIIEQWAPVAGALLAVTVASAIALRWLVPTLDMQKRGMAELHDENRVCEYRLNAIIVSLQKQGITVPPEAWGYPPDIAEKLGL